MTDSLQPAAISWASDVINFMALTPALCPLRLVTVIPREEDRFTAGIAPQS